MDCTNYPNDIKDELRNLISSHKTSITEGDRYFDSFAQSLLSHSIYCYYLGVEKYVRGIELIERGDNHWGHVSQYYSSYFSSKSIMGLFGVGGEYIYGNGLRKFSCSQTIPGNIEIKFSNKNQSSHKGHWNIYYHISPQIKSYMPSQFHPACNPPPRGRLWMTEKRNDINYNPIEGMKLKYDYMLRDRSDQIFTNLPSDLLQQINLSKDFILLANFLIDDLKIKPKPFKHLFRNRKMNTILRRDIYNYKKLNFNYEKLKSIFSP